MLHVDFQLRYLQVQRSLPCTSTYLFSCLYIDININIYIDIHIDIHTHYTGRHGFFAASRSFAEEKGTDPMKAASFLDCENGDEFWQSFRSAYRKTGPLSPETGSLAYLKWKDWETFIDGMDENEAFKGRIFVPLAGGMACRWLSVFHPNSRETGLGHCTAEIPMAGIIWFSTCMVFG